MMINQGIKDIIVQYVETARNHGDAIENGDYKKANSNYKKNMKALDKLRQFGKEGCDELFNLLNHDNLRVRLSAATQLLNTKNKEAIHTLKKISKEPGIVGFSAKMVLKEWKSGNLKIPKWSE